MWEKNKVGEGKKCQESKRGRKKKEVKPNYKHASKKLKEVSRKIFAGKRG